MIVGFTTTCAISAYHHWCCEFESRSRRGVQHYVIKFVSDLRQIGGFLHVSFTNKTDRHDITEILLKVTLNTIKQTKTKSHMVDPLPEFYHVSITLTWLRVYLISKYLFHASLGHLPRKVLTNVGQKHCSSPQKSLSLTFDMLKYTHCT